MEKLIKPVIQAIDSFMPGYKTYFLMFMALAMMVCQSMGYHTFSSEAWGYVGVMGGITWKIGQDRGKK